MNLVIRKAKIIDPNSLFHNKICDLVITDGIITKIGIGLKNPANFDEIGFENLHVSIGWFDTSVSLGEPGFEERETINNGLTAAAKSGFTAIALQPNCHPITDNQSQINFVKSKAADSAVEIYPIGALTTQSDGKDLAELFDMKQSGAIAFGDYNKDLSNPNILRIALQYAQDFDGLIIAFSHDQSIAGHGVANEGIVATGLGLKGIPALAEELQIARNLSILEYSGGKLHIPTISTAKSVHLIKEAKSKGIKVTCSVSVHHLTMTDEKLERFEANYKVLPPLRTESDRKTLLSGVKDGTIDVITSDHNPIDIEHKRMEFDLAKFGTIGIESAFGALMTVLPLDAVIEKLTSGRAVFGIPEPKIAEGNNANLTFFNPEPTWQFTGGDILSKSKNSAFIGMKMKGKIYGILNRNKSVL